ncbi:INDETERMINATE(ID)-DOMAIN 15, SHOOT GRAVITROPISM 5, ARABIDOPSIS THALIANA INDETERMINATE(ID)-DOMAIN 15 [Hibiscus trionum]|uniref:INDETERMINATE(ID)-DOMAIN 15, SHOOT GRAVITROPISM 5, ARABIDOPSIS THALIANA INDETERMINATE(ID)-DOMAIN 15 n=1 Tax=Hibiscus trionum TaxID=183268 RepID=A0A9W7MSH9_HIBTR|nr:INDETERMINATE(ID)-DOMAIN 15, SHOOT GRAVITROPISM 5, ARABIDOPSIS THALIANA INDETERMINATE(ID)-DOMAIN 15 [Hibiscus trionum]
MLDSTTVPVFPSENGVTQKRKRRPAGTPDPDAEVVSLSPRTLLESDRYICEICNQGFQRDQNLQMHRRRHKVPWKLLRRETQEVKKRVYVCPEPSCLHHHPCHALGDLVGIKKHFRRKHSNHKKWVCHKCSKAYAVQSDYKAHLKICGTRGHSCDCGRVFSRVESFIEHQDACTGRGLGVHRPESQALHLGCSSRTDSSTSPSSDTNFGMATAVPGLPMLKKSTEPAFMYSNASTYEHRHQLQHNLELQLLPSSTTRSPRNSDENCAAYLKLSIGSSEGGEKGEAKKLGFDTFREKNASETAVEANKLKEFASSQLKLAMAENTYAEKAKLEAKKLIQMAELEFASAKRLMQQAQDELEKAQVLKDQATKKISTTVIQITCQACKHQFQTPAAAVPADETSLAMSYMSTVTTEGEVEWRKMIIQGK